MTDIPPPAAPPRPRWATRISTRRPELKTYVSRGHAISSIACKVAYEGKVSGDPTLWEWVDEQWVQVPYRICGNRSEAWSGHWRTCTAVLVADEPCKRKTCK